MCISVVYQVYQSSASLSSLSTVYQSSVSTKCIKCTSNIRHRCIRHQWVNVRLTNIIKMKYINSISSTYIQHKVYHLMNVFDI